MSTTLTVPHPSPIVKRTREINASWLPSERRQRAEEGRKRRQELVSLLSTHLLLLEEEEKFALELCNQQQV